MGIARKLEQRLEQMVDGLSAAIFRGSVGPLELAGRLVRQADLQVTDGEYGPTIPNHFSVHINPKDIDLSADLTDLEHALERALEQEAAERGWRTGGPLKTVVVTDGSVPAGSVQCEAQPRPGLRPTWGQLIDVAGQTVHPLTDNRTTIGRSRRADVTLDLAEVSRMHAMIVRRSGSYWVADLESSNGTAVNEDAIGTSLSALRAGDQLSVGPARFIFRIV